MAAKELELLENANPHRRTLEAKEAPRDGEYRSLTQIIVSRLRKSIFEGAYGPGTRLNISDLSKQLDVSPIPIREALRLLEAEGLVTFHLNRGVLVRQLSGAELRELFLIRLPLETLAATEAAQWRTEKSLNTMASILARMDATRKSETWHALHERFHEELYGQSQLPRLSQIVAGLRGQMRPYAKLYHEDPEQMRHVQKEHYALLDAVRHRKKEKIIQIIREHLARPARLALIKLSATDVAL